MRRSTWIIRTGRQYVAPVVLVAGIVGIIMLAAAAAPGVVLGSGPSDTLSTSSPGSVTMRPPAKPLTTIEVRHDPSFAGDLILKETRPFSTGDIGKFGAGETGCYPYEGTCCSDYVSNYGSEYGYDIFVGSYDGGAATDCIPYHYTGPNLDIPVIDANYVYWELTGDVGAPNACGGTISQCAAAISYYVDGCDLEATFHIWWYGSAWWDLLDDYEIIINNPSSCD